MQTKTKRFTTTCAILLIATTFLLWRNNRRSGVDVVSAAPTQVQSDDTGTHELTMSDVLEMAVAARANMAQNLDDYTARFVKQETDTKGVLGEETEMLIKVQTPLRGNTEQAAMRVYLSFQAPESLMGREVIWAEDLHDGKMAVHEVGLLLSLKTIWLDPNGMIAMQGQRYPISEIGMVRLVEKLIERGEKDRDNPDISVTVSRDHMLGDTPAELIQVRRAKPSSDKDDFSLAEIVIDHERQLILKYRSFGWPDTEGSDPPLIESYFYDDVQTNIGLSEADFDPANPNYSFPFL